MQQETVARRHAEQPATEVLQDQQLAVIVYILYSPVIILLSNITLPFHIFDMSTVPPLQKNSQALTPNTNLPFPLASKGTHTQPCSRQHTHSRDMIKKGGVSGGKSPVGR